MIPGASVVKTDLMMAMVHQLPSDLFDELYQKTVELLQHHVAQRCGALSAHLPGDSEAVTAP